MNSLSPKSALADGPGEWIAPERTALVVIDVQADFARLTSPVAVTAAWAVR